MTGFIPEITSRVSVTMNTEEIDNALEIIESDPILSEITSLTDELQNAKNNINELQEPLVDAVAERLASNQEIIISTKHYITGMMANSVDIASDGQDRLVGNTATSYTGFPYPLAIETGRRAVYPVDAKVLRWFDGGVGGKPIFSMYSRSVAADPFVEPSVQNTLWDIDEIWDSL